ncbi:hypothetical protein [Hymenobacter pini]|uniref:hypothetical protein n=1 Tax=Hymenobacter pini TaxID=2880879 RepID=UPI001CF51973|nr:hypothetical protein [Hymenobacter pini]MCA8831948.1 hypothetical protein [Hymenobacter pini]
MSSLQIPVRPHVLKYLSVHLGENYHLSLGDQFGIMLLCLLRRPLVDKRKESSMAEYTAKFHFDTTGYPAQKWGLRSFTTGTIYLFGKYVDEVMMKEMYGQVATNVDNGQGLHDSINEWRAKYDFTDSDKSFDAVKKSYQRQRREDRTRTKTVRVAPLKAVRVLKNQLLKLPPVPTPMVRCQCT